MTAPSDPVPVVADGDRRRVALLASLEGHEPISERERSSVRRVVALLGWLPRPFDRDADPTHVTASAIVVDGHGATLLHRHRRLRRWLQPGGHVDRDEPLAVAALREATEETGVALAHPPGGPLLLHVDVHPGPSGHVHLDVRYALVAVAGAVPRPAPGESVDVAWFAYDAAAAVADISLVDALAAARRRSRHLPPVGSDGPTG